MKSFVFGKSANNIPIAAHEWSNSGAHVLIIGGVHGDETEGIIAAQGLLEAFLSSFTYKLRITLIPMFNIDGILNKTRQNSNGVDLNRNLPTQDWTNEIMNPRYYPGPTPASELETKTLVKYLESDKPRIIFTLHSWKPLLNVNGRCRREAEAIQKLTGYSIETEIGYATPGCLGTYCGLERDIPTLTYEIERGLDAKSILKTHVPAILEALKVTEALA